MGYKVIPRHVTMKVGKENELPEHSFIYYLTSVGPDEVTALVFEPASEEDGIKAAAADLAWHIAKARLK